MCYCPFLVKRLCLNSFRPPSPNYIQMIRYSESNNTWEPLEVISFSLLLCNACSEFVLPSHHWPISLSLSLSLSGKHFADPIMVKVLAKEKSGRFFRISDQMMRLHTLLFLLSRENWDKRSKAKKEETQILKCVQLFCFKGHSDLFLGKTLN